MTMASLLYKPTFELAETAVPFTVIRLGVSKLLLQTWKKSPTV